MSWTIERRKKQSEAIRGWKPWEKSTGPKTPQGITASARNSLKHGGSSREARELINKIRDLTRESNKLIREIRLDTNQAVR